MDLKKQIYQSFWQGIIKIYVLHHAAQGPIYGGRLSKTLRNLGYDISPGSLYPLLHALEKADLLRCRLKVFKGRVRKYYEVTAQGQACLEEFRQEVAGLVKEVIFGALPNPSPSLLQERSAI